MSTVNILVLGPTGVGKSAACNYICKCLQMANPHFIEDDGVSSHTKDPVDATVGGYRIVDNPGMLDTGGPGADRKNIVKIVAHAKNLGYINAVIVLVNNENPRFDEGIMNAIKVYVDSFGSEVLNRLGILYTRTFRGIEKLPKRTEDNRGLINKQCHPVSVSHIPSWYIDCHPEGLIAEVGASDQKVTEIQNNSKRQVEALLRWAAGKTPPYPTAGFVIGSNAHDNTVVRTETQKRGPREVNRRTYDAGGHWHWVGGLGNWLGGGKREYVPNNVTEVTYVVEEREVKYYGNGTSAPGEWQETSRYPRNV